MKTYLKSLFILVTTIAGAQADHSCMFGGLLEKSVRLTLVIFTSPDYGHSQSLSITDVGEMCSR